MTILNSSVHKEQSWLVAIVEGLLCARTKLWVLKDFSYLVLKTLEVNAVLIPHEVKSWSKNEIITCPRSPTSKWQNRSHFRVWQCSIWTRLLKTEVVMLTRGKDYSFFYRKVILNQCQYKRPNFYQNLKNEQRERSKRMEHYIQWGRMHMRRPGCYSQSHHHN